MSNVTWELTTVSAVTLSGGNLVVTNTGTTSANQGAHVATADAKTSGKYYFEVTWTTVTANPGGNRGVGIGTTASTYTNMGNGGTTGIEHYWGGTTWSNGSQVLAGSGAWVQGQIAGFAVDLDNRRFWFRLTPSGNWNNSGTANPATNVGGLTIPAGTMVPFVTFGGSNGGAGNVTTANFGDSAFNGAVPSGFTAGWSTAAPNYVDLAGNLSSPSSYGKFSYGVKHYSRIDAFALGLAADVSVSAGITFSGDLAPVVSFAADVGVVWGISGDLAPAVTFAGDLVTLGFRDFVGGIVPQVALGGSLAVDVSLTALEGGLTANVALEALSFISGPLWAASEPCPAAPWMETEPCPPPAWMLSAPCAPVAWTPSRTCNG